MREIRTEAEVAGGARLLGELRPRPKRQTRRSRWRRRPSCSRTSLTLDGIMDGQGGLVVRPEAAQVEQRRVLVVWVLVAGGEDARADDVEVLHLMRHGYHLSMPKRVNGWRLGKCFPVTIQASNSPLG